MQPDIEKAVALTKRGDRESIEKALSLLQKTVFSFSMNVCGQRQDAEDTMQEVLLRSLPYLPKFDNAKALAVWLYKVAKSRCLMGRRRSRFARQPDLSLEALMPDGRELQALSSKPEQTPEAASMKREGMEMLRDAVLRLSPEYRLVLVLRDMEDLSDEQVAAIMGLKPGTVRVRLHRARLFVRKELAKKRNSWKRPPQRSVAAPLLSSRAAGSGRCRQLFAKLSDYLDDAMSDSLCRELKKHLAGCAPCEEFLKDLEQTVELCRKAPAAGPDPHQAAELRRDLFRRYRKALEAASHAPKPVSSDTAEA